MLCGIVSILSCIFYSLSFRSGSFPKPLTEEEEKHYLALSQQGDLEARNILVERNLRLVAHVMKTNEARSNSVWRTDGVYLSMHHDNNAKIYLNMVLN